MPSTRNAKYIAREVELHVLCHSCNATITRPGEPEEKFWSRATVSNTFFSDFDCPRCGTPNKLPAKLGDLFTG